MSPSSQAPKPLIDELRWRGMFHDMMPGTDEHLAAHAPVTGYIGFDPTAASLHIGNLATIMLLVHLQRAGHRPVALVGGATGMIGDPSGKSAERNLLDEDTLRRNQAGIRAQLEKFLDFTAGPTGALVVNNYDWFKNFGFLDFLREVGKHLTVNYMMAKDSVQKRIGINKTVDRINSNVARIKTEFLDEAVRLIHEGNTEKGLEMLNTARGYLDIVQKLSDSGFEQMREEAAAFFQKTIFSSSEDTGISYTEFSYQLLQGYDFVHLHRTLGCTLQMGASDQWGNITTGTELIRRLGSEVSDSSLLVAGSEEASNSQPATSIQQPETNKAYALTGQLITKADGTKYGKSETGTVWLDAELTSPYQFYQFFLNSADADAPRLIRVFTLLSQQEIEQLEAEHAAAPHLRTLQKALAYDVTARVHSPAAADTAVAASQVLFGGGDLASLDAATLRDVFAGVPHLQVPRTAAADLDVVTLLSDATDKQIFPSKGEARKLIQNNGVSINREKLSAPDTAVTAFPALHDRFLVVQKGKKNYYLIELT